MCKNSASEKICIVYPNKVSSNLHTSPQGFALQSEDPVKTFETQDHKIALTSYEKGGASLILRGSQEFRNLYINSLNEQIGFNFGV